MNTEQANKNIFTYKVMYILKVYSLHYTGLPNFPRAMAE